MTDWRIYLAWAIGLGLALSGPVLPLFALPGGTGAMLLVVTPPWRDSIGVIERAGGRPIGPEASLLGRFATSDGADFPARLRASGAWAVLDGQAVATLCGWEVT